MVPKTDKSWRDYRALNQKWSYQPTLAGRAILSLKSWRDYRALKQNLSYQQTLAGRSILSLMLVFIYLLSSYAWLVTHSLMLKPFSVSKNIMGHIRLCVNGFCREFPISTIAESHYKMPEYRPCM